MVTILGLLMIFLTIGIFTRRFNRLTRTLVVVIVAGVVLRLYMGG